MTTTISRPSGAGRAVRNAGSARAEALAARLIQGANALTTLAESLTETQWQARIPHDGRKVGVVVHHVGNMYPLEIQLAQLLATGNAVENLTWEAVDALNATHAAEHADVSKAAALELLARNSAAAAAAIRALSDDDLDRAAPVSLNADAPLTCQFMIEDHALRHSYHHLAKIRSALEAAGRK